MFCCGQMAAVTSTMADFRSTGTGDDDLALLTKLPVLARSVIFRGRASCRCRVRTSRGVSSFQILDAASTHGSPTMASKVLAGLKV